jgi:hypothetical protein
MSPTTKHFDTRVSADLKVRFGGASTTAQRKEVQQLPVINALTSTPSNRDVRVHEARQQFGAQANYKAQHCEATIPSLSKVAEAESRLS